MALACKNISLQLEGKPILKDVNFTLESGEHLLVLGPSGSGKTTLLSILTGLQKPDAGTVCFNEMDLYSLSGPAIDRFRGQHMGIVFQTFHLIDVLSVQQNLLLAQSLPGKTRDETQIDDVLNRLGLREKAGRKAGTLSVGEAQRVAVARAVATSPQWLFCDEPTSALDDHNAHAMLALLEEEAARCHASLIIVTHDNRVRKHFTGRRILELGGSIS